MAANDVIKITHLIMSVLTPGVPIKTSLGSFRHAPKKWPRFSECWHGNCNSSVHCNFFRSLTAPQLYSPEDFTAEIDIKPLNWNMSLLNLTSQTSSTVFSSFQSEDAYI